MEIGERLTEAELCPLELLADQEAAFQRDIDRMLSRSSEFVVVSCPACASARSDEAFGKFGFHFQKCKSCGTLFMNPRPSEAVLADYYANSENYQIWAEQIFPASEESRKQKLCVPWLNRIVEYCDTFQVSRDVLVEIGPGFGTFAQVATESGSFGEVLAIEPTPELAQACSARGVNVVRSRVEDIEESAMPQASVVVAFEVIEHLFEPAKFLSSAHSLLDDKGLLILSCPNGMGFDISVLGPNSLAVDAEHVNLFNPESLSTLLTTCGFEILEVSTPGRLDAEFVRDAALREAVQLDPFLERVLISDWDKLGWPFQQFLANHGLSSHMWTVARKCK